jgi:predicted metalloprotease
MRQWTCCNRNYHQGGMTLYSCMECTGSKDCTHGPFYCSDTVALAAC